MTYKNLYLECPDDPFEVTKNKNGLGVTLVRRDMTINSGISYVYIGVDISGFSLEDLLLLFLFTCMVKDNGAGNMTDVVLSRMIGTYTCVVGVTLNFWECRKKVLQITW